MIKSNSYLTKDPEELFQLLTKNIELSKKVGILGGHYMLLYNSSKKILEESIWQNSDNKQIQEFSKIIMGDFPSQSFSFSLKLINRIGKNGNEVNLFLLVNDHYFHSANGRQFFKSSTNHIKLKRDYFERNGIPDFYTKLGVEYGLNLSDYVNKPINSKGMASNNPYLISETQLRRKFDRSLRITAANNTYFQLRTNDNAKSELYFKHPEYSDICMTQFGECGCSGEVMQLLNEIIACNYDYILLLVPNECHDSVSSAVIPALTLSLSAGLFVNRVVVVSGFGDNNYTGLNSHSYRVDTFNC